MSYHQKEYCMEDLTLFPTNDPDFVSFEFGAPGKDLLPSDLIKKAADACFSSPASENYLQYGPSLGSLPFREVLADFLTNEYQEQAPVTSDKLVITNGASGSFSKVLEDHGIGRDSTIKIPIDDDGLRVDLLEKAIENSPPVEDFPPSLFGEKRFKYLLFLVPTYSNPTGRTLSTERRAKLVEIARKHDILVVCDDVYHLLPFEGSRPPPRLVSFDLDTNGFGNVISNQSFSKILAPGLRLGWVEASTGIIQQYLKSGLMYSGGCPNHVTSGIIEKAIRSGDVKQHLHRLRTIYRERMNAMVDYLQANLKSFLSNTLVDTVNMSYAYVTEPPTKGKVVMSTTLGDLEIELWPKEAPKATRNFVQLCMEGYYDNTIFHRIVKGFIVQGGDPTGTGLGGESVYDEPFADEFHSRLRFSHRGLLAMANTGRNSNRSQFFFTLDKTDDLNRKNTIFGKIVGDTIYNLLKMGELETDDNEKPAYPPRIKSVQILSNPFDDIEPRTTPEEKAAKAAMEKLKEQKESEVKKPKGKKNFNLLSFGDEAAEEDASVKKMGKKIKSSHDLVDDGILSKESALPDKFEPLPSDLTQSTRPSKRKAKNIDTESDEDDNKKPSKKTAALSEDIYEEKERKTTEKKSQVQSEIAKIQQEIKGMNASRREAESSISKKPASLLDSYRQQYVGKAIVGKRVKGSDSDILKNMERFRNKIHAEKSDSKGNEPGWVCGLHGVEDCKSCRSNVEDDGGDDKGWLAHNLRFKKEAANVYEPTVDDYTYFDPRESKVSKKRDK
ncbi:Peptidyl-prolyl isomerase cwc27 [Blyttiomyces sp. JEL0837]|nr:Peptidyl-prolyl isomerase cwc27 [Blyttiomyces sp. JEL0837]